MKIKNIIFDFGGVILKHRKAIMEEFISKMFSIPFKQASGAWKENRTNLATGEISSKEFLKNLKVQLKSDSSVNKLLETWSGLYQKETEEVNWELLDFIKDLKSKYQVILFTDTIDVHDEYNRKRGIYERFHQVFKSFEEKTIKTDKNAFLNVLKKIKSKPEECIFIDDLELNVKNAESLGMKGIIFRNNGQLKEEIKQFIKL